MTITNPSNLQPYVFTEFIISYVIMSAGYFKSFIYVIAVALVTCAPSGGNPRTTLKTLPKKGLTWNNVTTNNVTSQTVRVASNGNLRINPGDMTHYLKCTTCLTECVKVRRSAIGYFFCTNCIRSCVNNLDSFMHFFSSHKCTFVNEAGSQGDQNPVTSIPRQVLGDYLWDSNGETQTDTRQTSSNNSRQPTNRPTPIVYNKAANQGNGQDYFDQYINKNLFQNSDCPETKQKYENISIDYAQCQQDLGNCRSGWDVNNYGYGDYGDEYGSQLTTQHTPAPKDDIFNLIKKLESNLAHVMESIIPLTQNITGVPSFVPAQVIEDPYEKILVQHKTRFMSVDEFQSLSEKEWEYEPTTVASLKSVLRRNNNDYFGEKKRKTPVCPGAFKVHLIYIYSGAS